MTWVAPGAAGCRAYFEEGRSVADHDELVALAAEVGLDADEARAVLRGAAFADAMREDERTASQLGASGVPFFVVDRRIAVSGAQDPDVLLQLLERAWRAGRPRPCRRAPTARRG